MTKRKSFIELQSKPQNREVRKLVEKPETIEYAPLNSANLAAESDDDSRQGDSRASSSGRRKRASKKAQSSEAENVEIRDEKKASGSKIQNAEQSGIVSKIESPEKNSRGANNLIPNKSERQTGQERLRIFQTSSPHTRAVTQYHKAAIIVRGAGGRQTIELAWRDQMNEKTRDIWDYLVKRFKEAAELDAAEILIRKRDVLENSGVKSDRTFISAIYTLEDMELIRVRRLSGNKQGNVYVLTGEGREEIESYRKS